MRERAALVGGTLDIESTLGSGTTLFARIPFQANHTKHVQAYEEEKDSGSSG